MTGRGFHLVVGADGLLGRAVVRELEARGVPFLATTRRKADPGRIHLDLADPATRRRLPGGPLAAAYLLAGVTALEACRRSPAASARVNVEATLGLARDLGSSGSRIVFPSSNLVFDGTVARPGEADPVSPRTEYGRQKAAVETELLRGGVGAVVVRFTKVLGNRFPLGEQWVEELRAGRRVRPATGMVFSPVAAAFAARVLVEAASRRSEGMLHVSADRDLEYADVAKDLAARIGVGPDRVEPAPASDLGLDLEHQPLHTALGTVRLESEFGLGPPSAWDTIREVSGPWVS